MMMGTLGITVETRTDVFTYTVEGECLPDAASLTWSISERLGSEQKMRYSRCVMVLTNIFATHLIDEVPPHVRFRKRGLEKN
jgi:hypothetical protein